MKEQEVKKWPIDNWAERMWLGYRQPESRFLEYNINEQKECINAIRQKVVNPLYLALENRYCLEIIKSFVLFDQESLHNTKKLFASYSDRFYLYHIPQKEVLSYLLSILNKLNISYDPVHTLKTVVKFCNDNDVLYFLNLHSHLLNPELCQSLLDISCELIIRPQCIIKLVSLGAQLQNYHFKKMSTFLDHPAGHWEKDKEVGMRDQDLLNLLTLMREQKISVPIFPSYFANFGEIASKKLLVTHLPEDNSHTLLKLENAIIKVAHYGEVTFEEDRFLLDNIQIVFNRFPQYQPAHSEEFEFVAFCAIRLQHPLIHTLLERGLTLTQKFNCLESWPADMKFSNPQGNTLADMVAFYSNDTKLLAKLRNIFSINQLNRTPSHYAVLSLCELYKKITSKSYTTRSAVERIYDLLLRDASNDDIVTFNTVRTLSEEIQIEFCYYYVDFSYIKPSLQFKSIGSPNAYKNINFTFDADIKDVIGFTPLDYAGMLADENRRNSILRQYSIFLCQWLQSLQIMPSVLIDLTVQYTQSYEDSAKNLVIQWAEKFVEKRNLFSAKIQSWLIDPLQSKMNQGQKLIKNPSHIFLARVIMQVFNLATCVGTASCFNGSAIIAKKTFRGVHSSNNSLSAINGQSFLVTKKRNRSEDNEPHNKELKLK